MVSCMLSYSNVHLLILKAFRRQELTREQSKSTHLSTLNVKYYNDVSPFTNSYISRHANSHVSSQFLRLLRSSFLAVSLW